MEQVTSFGEFIKGSEQQMSSQLNRMEEKYERELTELEKFTKTLMTIIKKLSQDHDTLYKKTNDVEWIYNCVLWKYSNHWKKKTNGCQFQT